MKNQDRDARSWYDWLKKRERFEAQVRPKFPDDVSYNNALWELARDLAIEKGSPP